MCCISESWMSESSELIDDQLSTITGEDYSTIFSDDLESSPQNIISESLTTESSEFNDNQLSTEMENLTRVSDDPESTQQYCTNLQSEASKDISKNITELVNEELQKSLITIQEALKLNLNETAQGNSDMSLLEQTESEIMPKIKKLMTLELDINEIEKITEEKFNEISSEKNLMPNLTINKLSSIFHYYANQCDVKEVLDKHLDLYSKNLEKRFQQYDSRTEQMFQNQLHLQKLNDQISLLSFYMKYSNKQNCENLDNKILKKICEESSGMRNDMEMILGGKNFENCSLFEDLLVRKVCEKTLEKRRYEETIKSIENVVSDSDVLRGVSQLKNYSTESFLILNNVSLLFGEKRNVSNAENGIKSTTKNGNVTQNIFFKHNQFKLSDYSKFDDNKLEKETTLTSNLTEEKNYKTEAVLNEAFLNVKQLLKNLEAQESSVKVIMELIEVKNFSERTKRETSDYGGSSNETVVEQNEAFIEQKPSGMSR